MLGRLYKLIEGFTSQIIIFFRACILIWDSAPIGSTSLALLLFLQGITPAIGIWLSKLVIDLIVSASQGESVGFSPWQIAILWGANLSISVGLTPWTTLIQGNVNEKLGAYVKEKLIFKTNSLLDLTPFENADLYDEVKVLKQGSRTRPQAVLFFSVSVLKNTITIVTLLFLLGNLAWWLPVAVLASTIPLIIMSIKVEKNNWWAIVAKTPEARKMDYLSNIAMDTRYAKEIRLFQLGPFIEREFMASFHKLHKAMSDARLRTAAWPVPSMFLSIGGNVGAFIWVVLRAINGSLSAGNVLVLLQSLGQLNSQLSQFAYYASQLGSQLLFFEKYFSFMAFQSEVINDENASLLAQDSPTIAFENVCFTYPDGRQALNDVSFCISPQDIVAVVGENGAGKTTLVKLITRMYDPTAGRILIDGKDLRNIDILAWRSKLSAVFQDFGKYDFTVRENIALGDYDVFNDENRLRLSIRDGGASEMIDSLPQQLDTPLGKQFGGTELSGGQWQRIAITRALIRNPQILILDEPTASLDPQAEIDLFKKFYEISRRRTTFLITHRLASVQMTKRILVLNQGKLIEEGSHLELMKLEGEYARLFKLQAESFDHSAEVDNRGV